MRYIWLFITLSISSFSTLALGSAESNAKSSESALKASATDNRANSAKLNLVAIRAVVKKNMPAVQQCYTDLIVEGMAASGKVTVTWDIDDKGAVQNVAVKDPKPEQQALSGCVTEKVGAWVFPAAEPEKTFPVTYTFNFGS